jgi:hypothetical protein
LEIHEPYAVLNSTQVTSANIVLGTITIQDAGASGGTPPYIYQ